MVENRIYKYKNRRNADGKPECLVSSEEDEEMDDLDQISAESKHSRI